LSKDFFLQVFFYKLKNITNLDDKKKTTYSTQAQFLIASHHTSCKESFVTKLIHNRIGKIQDLSEAEKTFRKFQF
jgi:hypothetical protein